MGSRSFSSMGPGQASRRGRIGGPSCRHCLDSTASSLLTSSVSATPTVRTTSSSPGTPGRHISSHSWTLSICRRCRSSATVSVAHLHCGLPRSTPDRVRRLVLMGSAGVSFPITPALDAVWGYQPSLERMAEVMKFFAFDRSRITDDLIRLRYEASIRPGIAESYSEMFPSPRQSAVEALALSDDRIRQISQKTLVVHGRDDRVIPLQTSLRLNQLIDNSEMHVFGRCGHWVQIEAGERFAALVDGFLHR